MTYGEMLEWQSVSTNAIPALEVGDVHLWWVALDIDEKQAKAFLPHLSAKQQQRMERLPTPEKCRHYLAGRGFLRQLLCAYLNVDTFELAFGQHGKPMLKNQDLSLKFNFSDTCGYGLFAFSLDVELGVDLESNQRRGRFQQISNRRFSTNEKALLEGQSAEQFLACWTRKEAYGKALGVGLNYPLNEVVLCDSLTDSVSTSPDGNWCLQQIKIQHETKEFIACLTSAGEQVKKLTAFKLAAN